MADGGDILGSLPPSKVKFKDKMEDIREATIEGSQFEAQYPEERTQLPLVAESPQPSTPRPNTSAHKPVPQPRPKTTLRRTASEKSVEDVPVNENLNNTIPASLKFGENSTLSSRGPSLNGSPTISRKSTQELLVRKSSQDPISRRQNSKDQLGSKPS